MSGMKPLAILKNYFGFRKEEFRSLNPETGERLSGMADFAGEIKQLSPDEKAEMVEGAAIALGVEIDRT